jgi:tetratricopeptide (TPR) repeat protein
MRWIAVLLAISLVCITASHALAQKRVALVIGNDAYVNQPRLDNAGRDARVIGAALQKVGFKLVGDRPLIDLDKATTDRMVEAFTALAQDADIALFYYSGHGIQIGGTNYLLPIDLRSVSPATVDFQTLNADLVLKVMENSRARVKMMLLDACRTNPFIRRKDQGGGLAQMQALAGTVIGFATQPNNAASEGPVGGNSPYAAALATYIGVRGIELFALLNEVGLDVMAKTNNLQQPWISASPIAGRVYLNPPDILAVPLVRPTPQELRPASPPIVGYAPSEPVTGQSLQFIQLAYKQLENKDYAGARATLTQGIEEDRNFAPAFSYRGFAWYLEGKTKDPQEALAAYRQGFPDLDRAIELDPRDASVRRHRGDAIVASYSALQALGKPTNDILDRAVDDLKAAVTLDPTSKLNANALGAAYLLKGSYRSAIESFNRAIERDRSYAAPYSGLCVAYRMLGDSVAARKNAQLAADRDRDLRSKSCLKRGGERLQPSPAAVNVPTVEEDRSGLKGSFWDHNGSLMHLVVNGRSRRFYYENPRPAMKAEGVSQGTLLFDGKREGTRFVGKAVIFGCARSFEYRVSGPISKDEHTVTLFGKAPRLDENCNRIGERDDELIFTYETILRPPLRSFPREAGRD